MIAEDALQRAWGEVLGSAAGADDDFFACGGDSLMALTVASSLCRQLGVVVEPGWLYEVPRFADALADLQSRVTGRAGDGAQIAAGPRGGDHPLSFQQEGLLQRRERSGDRHHDQLAYAVAVPAGSLDQGRLRAAVAWASQRHPALRTRVVNQHQHVEDRAADLQVFGSSTGTQMETARAWSAEPFTDGGPLARFALIAGAEEDLLVLAAHQLVMDPWSWGLLLREIASCYSAPDDTCNNVSDCVSDRTDPRVLAYSDYARWQRQTLSGPVYAGHLEFWRAAAAGYPAGGVPLPGMPEGVAPAGPASRLPVAVSAALVTGLQEIGRRPGATLFQVLLALFHAAVASWTGVPDVVVGSATANRTLPGTDRVVGFFVNGRFTRSTPGRHASLPDLVVDTRDQWRAGDAHQELHLEKTVFDLGVPDLVNIKFSLDSIPTLDPLPLLGRQRLRPIRLAVATTACRHLALSLVRDDDAPASGRTAALVGGLTYRTDVLTAASAADLLERFDQMLRRAVADSAGR